MATLYQSPSVSRRIEELLGFSNQLPGKTIENVKILLSRFPDYYKKPIISLDSLYNNVDDGRCFNGKQCILLEWDEICMNVTEETYDVWFPVEFEDKEYDLSEYSIDSLVYLIVKLNKTLT